MLKFKIIAVPPGGAPLNIRKEWVGLELPIEENLQPGIMRSVSGGTSHPRSMGGYPVAFNDAVAALQKKSPAAAVWWQKWFDSTGGTGKTLVFARDVCELVGNEKPFQPKSRVAAMTANNRRI